MAVLAVQRPALAADDEVDALRARVAALEAENAALRTASGAPVDLYAAVDALQKAMYEKGSEVLDRRIDVTK